MKDDITSPALPADPEEKEIGVIVERDPDLATWEHDRIIIHRVTVSRMLAIGKKNFPDMWALYWFYFEKARKDKTNQPWALDKYCMKGLFWCKDHFYKFKKLLLDNGFIEQIVRKDVKGKITGFYIKVNHMNSTNNVQCPEAQDNGKKPTVLKNRTVEKPSVLKNLLVDKTDASALTTELEVLKKNNNSSDKNESPVVLDFQSVLKKYRYHRLAFTETVIRQHYEKCGPEKIVDCLRVFAETDLDKVNKTPEAYFTGILKNHVPGVEITPGYIIKQQETKQMLADMKRTGEEIAKNKLTPEETHEILTGIAGR